MKRTVSLLAMLAMVALTAAPALAQGKPLDVPRGQVEQGPAHANSICSFSGLNDTPDDPEEGGQVQSYGQIVGTLAKLGVHVNAGPGPAAPGTECNGHLSPYPEAFPPPAP
jgi:poly(3-hydroxybutyrate) depolymerase